MVAVALAVGVGVQEVPVNWHHDERTRVRVLARRRRDGRRDEANRAPRAAARTANAALGGAVDARTDWRSRSKAAFVATALRRTAGAGQSGLLVDAVVGGAGVTPKISWDPTGAIVVEGDARRAARRDTCMAS